MSHGASPPTKSTRCPRRGMKSPIRVLRTELSPSWWNTGHSAGARNAVQPDALPYGHRPCRGRPTRRRRLARTDHRAPDTAGHGATPGTATPHPAPPSKQRRKPKRLRRTPSPSGSRQISGLDHGLLYRWNGCTVSIAGFGNRCPIGAVTGSCTSGAMLSACMIRSRGPGSADWG